MNESTLGGKVDQITGSIKQTVGEATGNEELANKGAAQEVKGDVKEAWGNVKDTATDVSAQAAPQAPHDPTLREEITAAAGKIKDSFSGGLDHLKSE